MKLLFVCSDNYPHSGACCSLLNNLFFEGKLKNNECQIDLLTVRDTISQKKDEVYHGVNIRRVTCWEFLPISEIKKLIVRHPLLGIKGGLIKFHQKIQLRSQSKKFLNSSTICELLRGLSELRADEYDYIIAVSGNFNIAEAVRRCASRAHPQKFILYQVDPCATNYMADPHSIPAREKFEDRIYSEAYKVITTPIIKSEIERRTGTRFSDKIVPMEFPNVSMRSFTEQACKRYVSNSEFIKCLFTGNIYNGIRNPLYTFKLFGELSGSGVIFEFIGKSQCKINPKQIAENIHFLGQMDLEHTRNGIEQADFLVNIGNIMINQVPSKLFEYISTGKPIINICKNRNCPTLPYMEKYPLALNLFEDRPLDEQAEKLREFLSEARGKRVSKEDLVKNFGDCTPEYCAGIMIGVFRGL